VACSLGALAEPSSARPWAEAHNLTVLHVDRDYDLIAEVTGQPVERLVPSPGAHVAGGPAGSGGDR
jgi:hypothetical protein